MNIEQKERLKIVLEEIKQRHEFIMKQMEKDPT